MFLIKSLIFYLREIINHPLKKDKKLKSILSFFFWHIKRRFIYPKGVVIKWVNNSQLFISRKEMQLRLNVYYGLMEYEEMSFFLHVLRKNDLFIDVGSNVGSFTILASKVVGANTIAFEPVHNARERFKKQIELNSIGKKVDVRDKAIGNYNGKTLITNDKDEANYLVQNNDTQNKSLSEVEISKLDDELTISQNFFLKIDVEGFEYQVLKGAEKILSSEKLIGVIIELFWAERYNNTKQQLLDILKKNGLHPYTYEPKTRVLSKNLDAKNCNNVIFIKDKNKIEKICKQAPNFKIHTANNSYI